MLKLDRDFVYKLSTYWDAEYNDSKSLYCPITSDNVGDGSIIFHAIKI